MENTSDTIEIKKTTTVYESCHAEWKKNMGEYG
jgi:hypothetical protein